MLWGATAASGDESIKNALALIDPGAGKAKDTATELSVKGIVAAKLVLSDDKVVAFLHNEGEPALAIMASSKEVNDLIPRNAVSVAGKWGDGPFGAALLLKPGSVVILETNKPFTSAPVNGSLFKDASAMAGRYVQLTNATFTPGKFDAASKAVVKTTDGAEVTVVLGRAAVGRDVPSDPTDVFGVVVKAGSEWQIAAARFLPVNRKQCLDLATQRTCLSCHNPDKAVIGPAYRDVAAKYRNDPEALNKIMAQIENGGTGKWGTNVMIPLKTLVPPEERMTLANWIYSYRWDALLAE